jgi:hypothetical protein
MSILLEAEERVRNGSGEICLYNTGVLGTPKCIKGVILLRGDYQKYLPPHSEKCRCVVSTMRVAALSSKDYVIIND